MKKNLLLLIAICAVTLAFTSCNNSTQPDFTPVVLDGTTWKYSNAEQGITSTIVFSETTFTYKKVPASGNSDLMGAYKYTFPKIVLNTTTEDGRIVLTGSITGDQMTLIMDPKNPTYIEVYTKQ